MRVSYFAVNGKENPLCKLFVLETVIEIEIKLVESNQNFCPSSSERDLSPC